MIDAIDCQSFAGGFTLGMAQAGFNVVAKREESAGFGELLVQANDGLINGGIGDYQSADPEEWTPRTVPVVFGNPPCSGFSGFSGAASEGKRFAGTEKHTNINQCMWNLVRYAAACEAEIVIMESVQAAYRKGRALMQELRAEMERLTDKAYDLTHVLHNAVGLGGATIRPRYFMILSRRGLNFGIDEPLIGERVHTVMDAIGDLSAMPLARGPQAYVGSAGLSELQHELRSTSGYVDGHDVVPNRMVAGKAYLAAKGWLAGEKSGKAFDRLIASGEMTWEEVYASPMNHVKPNSEDRIANIYTERHPFTPSRLHADRPSPVLTGTGSRDFIHPTEHRVLTLREFARIMGFPDDWTLEPMWERPAVNEAWLGKGITVQAGRFIGEAAMDALSGRPGEFRGFVIGEDERLIDFTNDYKEVYNFRTGEHGVDKRSRDLRKMIEARAQQIEEDYPSGQGVV